MVSGSVFRWRPMTSGVLQGFVLGLLLLNTFFNEELEHLLYGDRLRDLLSLNKAPG